MATAPKPRKRPTNAEAPKSLVAQAAGEEHAKALNAETQWRNWNVRLPADLVERVWGTCQALEEAEDLPSAVAFTVRAFEELLDRLDAEHNDGQSFHADASPFRAGGRTTYKR
ncbi:hypothetical protein R3P82_07700 [Dietzia maris]|uniref:Centromere-binding protein ParB C-terminal domain-containing protein n=1 Tax=Dietzia maris TaxID=37915 RepID=A0AAE4QXK3_9ACTN|nr:hypothetical protein [Dietzia maris]MDV6298998.1 hypothetical protein [Dietzia maris]